ncbi:MAG: glycosyltransferase family 2 protein [Vampirovibrionales bacterium]|nr:glycosyltransferase family 2 protein [Vampirovibrionales bacterium]
MTQPTAPSQPVSVGVVVLNYSNATATRRCLESLKHLNYHAWQLVVVDNASSDDSGETIARWQGDHSLPDFTFIQSPTNGGYSAGNNLAIQQLLANGVDAVWILNNDTTVDPNALKALVEASQQTGGIVGSLLRYPDGTFQQAGIRVNDWTGQLRGYPAERAELATQPLSVDAISGASWLIPRTVLETVGLLPHEFFLYVEDVAYCVKAQRAGFPVHVAPNSIVYHEEGATTGRTSIRTHYYYHRNRVALWWQSMPWHQQVSMGLYTIYRGIRESLKNRRLGEVGQQRTRVFWQAVTDGWNQRLGPCPENLNQTLNPSQSFQSILETM